jgi:hypothetical protein
MKPRVRTLLEARLSGAAASRAVRVSDLSAIGCYVETLIAVTPGERIEIEIDLVDGVRIALAGVVTHFQQNMGFGLKFVDVPEKVRRQLIAAVDYMIFREAEAS